MRGAEILVKMLQAQGVDVLFGLPGDTTMAFYDALRDSQIRHVLGRDERSTGYMADAYARLSSKPGVVEAPSGGGATYLVPAAAESDHSSIPVILLTSDTPLSSDNRASITSLDQTALFDPVTRKSLRALRPEYIPHLVRSAFRSATAPPGGAAHIAFPEDVLSAEAPSDLDMRACSPATRYPAWRARPDDEAVTAAIELVRAAVRPLILCGGGVHLSRAGGAVLTLAEYLGAGIVTSMDGKGSVPEDHPAVLGVIGGNGAKEASNRAVSECDFLLAIGTKLNSTTTWGGQLLAHQPTLVHIDADPEKLGMNADPEVSILADARLATEDLLAAARDAGSPRQYPDWLTTLRRETDEEVQCAHSYDLTATGHLHPGGIFGVLEDTLPRESVLIADAGTPTPYMMAYYRTRGTGRTAYAARSHGSLGYALPAALGAHLARPGDPVVALVGDGSLNMTLGELETLAAFDGPTIVVHFRNEAYGWIKMLQKLYYEERYLSVDFSGRSSYVEAAEALGARAAAAANREEFQNEVERSLETNLSFIEVTVPAETELTPPVAAWKRDEALSPEARRRRSY